MVDRIMRWLSKHWGDPETWVCLLYDQLLRDASLGFDGTKCLLLKALRERCSELLNLGLCFGAGLTIVAAGALEESLSLWYNNGPNDEREGETSKRIM